MTKIIIPTENQNGLSAPVAQHFGRAPYFTIVELDKENQIKQITAETNNGEHLGGKGHPHDNLLSFKPDIIAAYGMGPGGLYSFKNSGVTVLKAEGTIVKEVIDKFSHDELEELTSGCQHAHEHHHGH